MRLERRPGLNDEGNLVFNGIIERCLEREFNELGYFVTLKQGLKSFTSSKISSVVITPVGYNCNLRCDYCFNRRGAEKASAVMDDTVLEKAILEVMSSTANPEFIWHGGEPLLAGLNFYRRVVSLQHKYNFLDNQPRNSLQSNGTLIDEEWARFFKGNNFKVGVSLDGPAFLHDRCRKYPGDKGSFQDVMEGIATLQKHGDGVGVLAVLRDHNSCSPRDLLKFFTSLGVRRFNVNPSLNHGALSADGFADFMCELFELWLTSAEPNLQIKFFEELIQSFWGLSSRICWLNGNCPSIIRIDQAGDVWPCCDRYLPFEQYKLGNILQESLLDIINGYKYEGFCRVFAQAPPRCLSCSWNHICKGGCAYHRLMNGNGTDGGDHMCGAYQKIFSHVFEKYNKLK